MITPPSPRSCIQCLARPVPPPRLSSYEMQLVHFWHQALGCTFASAAFRALGEIAAVAAELDVPVDPTCEICQRAWATPYAGILLDLEEKLRHCTPWPDRSALREALSARNAAIEGDSERVDLFSKSWLKLDRPAAWRPAVEMALLGDWVGTLRSHQGWLSAGADTVPVCRTRTRRCGPTISAASSSGPVTPASG